MCIFFRYSKFEEKKFGLDYYESFYLDGYGDGKMVFGVVINCRVRIARRRRIVQRFD